MNITITRAPDGGVTIAATAPTADPPTPPGDTGAAYLAPLCPPDDVDRTTGVIRALRCIVDVERTFAAAVAATQAASNLSGPVVAVLAHPGIGRLLVVGPFDQPADLRQWWRWRANRLAQANIVCLPLALTVIPTDTTGDA